ncbi:MAG: DUF4270 family protein [Bacteroidia bacterium]|nr:DUF4270 family protein [Bacteroidia bacterium]
MIHCWLKTSSKAVQRTALLFILPSLLFFSCRQTDDQVGIDFLPKGDNHTSTVVDTLSVFAYTVQEDSLKIDSLSSTILGAINDQAFGMRSASAHIQVLLREINVDFGANPTIDSVILSLARNTEVNGYGSTTSVQDFDIYRMAEIIEKEQGYYSNYEPALGDKIGTWSANLQNKDTSWFEEDGELKWATNTFRIPLNNSFGEDFFTSQSFGSNDAFLSFLNGISIVPATAGLGLNEGSIVSINKFSENSKLIIYYSGGLRKEFEINSESQNISTYSIENQPFTITDQLANPGTHYNETYLQSLAGTKLKIDIPNLLSLVADGETIAINEAKLSFTVKDGTNTDDFPAPSRLLLLQPSQVDGSNAFIIDLVDVLIPPSSNWVGRTNYGGSFDSETNTYTFRFNRHLQDVLETYLTTGEDINRGFYLVIPSDNPITPSRVILDTDNSGAIKNLDLKITYTKL